MVPPLKSHRGKQEMQFENQGRVKNNPFCTIQSFLELFGRAKRKNRHAFKAILNGKNIISTPKVSKKVHCGKKTCASIYEDIFNYYKYVIQDIYITTSVSNYMTIFIICFYASFPCSQESFLEK